MREKREQMRADPEGEPKCGSRGRGGETESLDPPGKSQVIWVSIGNKQLDSPPPMEKSGPPPLENVGPLGKLEK